MSEENFLSIVGYVDEEYSNLERNLKSIVSFLKESFKNFEIIIAADNSNAQKRHELSMIVNSLCLDAQISVIYLENVCGVDKSLSAAIDLSIGDYIVELPNINITIDVNMVYSLYKECLKGNDLCALVPQKLGLIDKLYYKIIKNNCYVNFQEYRENAELSVVSRRMINRVSTLKKQITNKWLFYKMSGLPCKYIYNNISTTYKRSEVRKSRINTLFIFTNFFIRLFCLLDFVGLLLAVLSLVIGKHTIACIMFSCAILLFALIFLMKKQALSLEYLWTDSIYQYGSIEKISKD